MLAKFVFRNSMIYDSYIECGYQIFDALQATRLTNRCANALIPVCQQQQQHQQW